MTTPVERTYAVLRVEELVRDLHTFAFRRGKTVRVPRDLLMRLVVNMRHYPTPSDIARSAEALPDVWAPPEAVGRRE